MHPYKINLVNQIDDVSCAIACMAMVAGVSFSKALEAVSDLRNPPIGDAEMQIGLCRLNVLSKIVNGTMLPDRVYICDVPSLNKKATLHSIVVDTRDGFEIYDPQFERPMKEFYLTGMLLNCYSMLFECTRVFKSL